MTILAVLVGCYAALAVPGVVLYADRTGEAVSFSCLAALVVLQLGYLSRPSPRPSAPGKYLALVAYAALIVVPMVLYGPLWRNFPGMLAGNVLLMLPVAAGVPMFVLVVLALSVLELQTVLFVDPPAPFLITYFLGSTASAGAAVYGLSTLVRLVVEAQAAREEARRAAVAQERLRFAHDLHDLIGQSLSAIALRGELVARLMTDQVDRARAELTEVLTVARRAMADVRSVVTVRREFEPNAQGTPGVPVDRPSLRPRFGIVMLVVVLAAYGIQAVVYVALSEGPGPAVGTALVRASIGALVVHLVQSGPHLSLRQRGIELLAVAALVWGPVAFLGPYSHGAEGQFMGAALVVLPVAPGLVLALLSGAGAVLTELLDPMDPTALAESLSYVAVGVVVLTVIVYGLSKVVQLVADVRAAKDEVSAVAVAQERVRFARDVHDLLGFSLSAVALKTELTGKLVGAEPDRARTELAELLSTTHRALVNVRSIANGDRELPLDAELAQVEATLAAADVWIDMQCSLPPPDGQVGTLLATVLREAATNVLRHSKAEWCTISLDEVGGFARLEIVNDGVGSGRLNSNGEGGNGLRNMTERVESLGGRLASSVEGGVFGLTVHVPLVRETSRAWQALTERPLPEADQRPTP